MTHKQALILILRILRDFQPDWSNQVWRVVQKLKDPDVEFCLVETSGFDPLPKILGFASGLVRIAASASKPKVKAAGGTISRAIFRTALHSSANGSTWAAV